MRSIAALTAIISTSALLLSAVAPVRAGTKKQGCDGAGKEAAVHGSEHKELAAQTRCPVMGGEINKEIYADHDGKRVHFCCPACIEKFKNDPDKYLGKLKESGQKPLTLTSLSPQSTCPVMGGAINRELYADYQGKRVYFCCAGCKAPFEKEPDKYLEKLRKSGQKPEVIAN